MQQQQWSWCTCASWLSSWQCFANAAGHAGNAAVDARLAVDSMCLLFVSCLRACPQVIADSEEDEHRLLASQGLQGTDMDEEDGSGSDGDDGSGSGSGSGSDSESDEDDNEEASMKKASQLVGAAHAGHCCRHRTRHSRKHSQILACWTMRSPCTQLKCGLSACCQWCVQASALGQRGGGGARARSSTRSGAAPSCAR